MSELARIIPLFPVPIAGAHDSGASEQASARSLPCLDSILPESVGSLSVSSPPILAKPESKNTHESNKTERPRNIVWDACVEAIGYEPKTASEKSLWGKMVKSLTEAGADANKIKLVAQWYRRHWKDCDLTITSLEKWYSHFLAKAEARDSKRPSATVGYCDYCGRRDGTHDEDCMKGKHKDKY